MDRIDMVSTQTECCVIPQRICWSAIFAGTFVGLGLGFLLHLYSAAIGLSAYSSDASGAAIIALGGFIGLLIGTMASFGVAGYVSGYLGRHHYCPYSGGILYGFITWSVSLILSALLIGVLMQYMTFYSHNMGANVSSDVPKVNITTAGATDDTPPIPTHANTTPKTAKNVTPTELAEGGWLIFVLFFVGAFSSCVGACLGMKCCKEQPIHRHRL